MCQAFEGESRRWGRLMALPGKDVEITVEPIRVPDSTPVEPVTAPPVEEPVTV